MITRGVFLGWMEFDHFTVEFEAPSDEARQDLLAALRDRKTLKITIEVEE
jgi:hypothetical protein